MGVNYKELQNGNSILLERKDEVFIENDHLNYIKRKKGFTREKIAAPENLEKTLKSNTRKKLKGCDRLTELLKSKDSMQKYQLACEIDHEIEKLKLQQSLLNNAKKEDSKNRKDNKGGANKNDYSKPWSQILKPSKEFTVGKYSSKHKFVCASPRYSRDESTRCRPRMRTIGLQKNSKHSVHSIHGHDKNKYITNINDPMLSLKDKLSLNKDFGIFDYGKRETGGEEQNIVNLYHFHTLCNPDVSSSCRRICERYNNTTNYNGVICNQNTYREQGFSPCREYNYVCDEFTYDYSNPTQTNYLNHGQNFARLLPSSSPNNCCSHVVPCNYANCCKCYHKPSPVRHSSIDYNRRRVSDLNTDEFYKNFSSKFSTRASSTTRDKFTKKYTVSVTEERKSKYTDRDKLKEKSCKDIKKSKHKYHVSNNTYKSEEKRSLHKDAMTETSELNIKKFNKKEKEQPNVKETELDEKTMQMLQKMRISPYKPKIANSDKSKKNNYKEYLKKYEKEDSFILPINTSNASENTKNSLKTRSSDMVSGTEETTIKLSQKSYQIISSRTNEESNNKFQSSPISENKSTAKFLLIEKSEEGDSHNALFIIKADKEFNMEILRKSKKCTYYEPSPKEECISPAVNQVDTSKQIQHASKVHSLKIQTEPSYESFSKEENISSGIKSDETAVLKNDASFELQEIKRQCGSYYRPSFQEKYIENALIKVETCVKNQHTFQNQDVKIPKDSYYESSPKGENIPAVVKRDESFLLQGIKRRCGSYYRPSFEEEYIKNALNKVETSEQNQHSFKNQDVKVSTDSYYESTPKDENIPAGIKRDESFELQEIKRQCGSHYGTSFEEEYIENVLNKVETSAQNQHTFKNQDVKVSTDSYYEPSLKDKNVRSGIKRDESFELQEITRHSGSYYEPSFQEEHIENAFNKKTFEHKQLALTDEGIIDNKTSISEIEINENIIVNKYTNTELHKTSASENTIEEKNNKIFNESAKYSNRKSIESSEIPIRANADDFSAQNSYIQNEISSQTIVELKQLPEYDDSFVTEDYSSYQQLNINESVIDTLPHLCSDGPLHSPGNLSQDHSKLKAVTNPEIQSHILENVSTTTSCKNVQFSDNISKVCICIDRNESLNKLQIHQEPTFYYGPHGEKCYLQEYEEPDEEEDFNIHFDNCEALPVKDFWGCCNRSCQCNLDQGELRFSMHNKSTESTRKERDFDCEVLQVPEFTGCPCMWDSYIKLVALYCCGSLPENA